MGGNSGSFGPCARGRGWGAAHLQVGCLLHCTALHCTRLHLGSPTCCSPSAERRRSVEPGVWEEDERTPPAGRRQPRAPPCHARDAERERPLLRPRDFVTPGKTSATPTLSRMFFPDGTLSAVTRALLLGLTCLAAVCDLAKGSADFSGQPPPSLSLSASSPVASAPSLGSARLDPCLWRAPARTPARPQCLPRKRSKPRL